MNEIALYLPLAQIQAQEHCSGFVFTHPIMVSFFFKGTLAHIQMRAKIGVRAQSQPLFPQGV